MHQKNFEWNYTFGKRLFDALTIITIGIVLLLNTTGVVSWAVWLNLLRLWPVWIISAGIMLIFSWSNLSRFVGALINYLIFLGVIVVSITSQSLNFNFNIFDTVGTNVNITQSEFVVDKSEFDQETSALNLDFEMSMSRFSITDSNEDEELLRINSLHSKNLPSPQFSKKLDEGTINVNFKEEGKVFFPFVNSRSDHEFTVSQSTFLENLKVKVGAGEGEINFDTLNIDTLDAEVGGGSLDISITESSTPAAPMGLKVGLGQITLNLEGDIGYKINYKVGLGSIQINNEDIGNSISKDGIYTSENYEDAFTQIELFVDVGLGSFRLNTI